MRNWWSPLHSCLCVLIGGVMFAAVTVTAQEQKPFFERDFAKNPLEEPSGSGVERGRSRDHEEAAQEPTERHPTPSSLDAVTRARERLEALKSGSESTRLTEITALAKTHKVVSIGGVLNALDKAHFEEKMKELLEVVERYDFDVGFIWAIGSVQNMVGSPETLYLVARRGIVEAAEAPPAHYKITMSPTWVIRTPEGEILLEATGPLAGNFNAKGEFIERPNEMRIERTEDGASPGSEGEDAPPPAPTVVPSATPDPLFGGVQPKL